MSGVAQRTGVSHETSAAGVFLFRGLDKLLSHSHGGISISRHVLQPFVSAYELDKHALTCFTSTKVLQILTHAELFDRLCLPLQRKAPLQEQSGSAPLILRSHLTKRSMLRCFLKRSPTSILLNAHNFVLNRPNLQVEESPSGAANHNKYCHFCQVRASSMLACCNAECSRRF